MLVGQALALLYLDPATIQRGGQAKTEDVIAQLVAARTEQGARRYSLSCNTDLTLDLLDAFGENPDAITFGHLPVLVGDGAPAHCAELLAMLAREPVAGDVATT